MSQDSPDSKGNLASKYGTLFLIVLSIFTISFCVFLYFANVEFRNSQGEIKKSYVDHIRRADSLYFDMVVYNKEYVHSVSDINAAILTDSLVKNAIIPSGGLAQSQYQNLSTIISSHFENIEKMHATYDDKLTRDSLLLVTERQVLEGQTKTMLDLHLNKIEHEYSNITIWAAVLTILFLVFSFYSIFKMDELIQQGNEGVKDIRQLHTNGENLINSISEKGEKTFKKADEKLKNFVNSQQQIVAETIGKTNSMLENQKELYRQIINELEDINKTRDEYTKILSNQLEQIETRYDKVLQEKIKELYSDMEAIRQFMDDNGIKHQDI